MKLLIVYYSWSNGNTQKIAEDVYKRQLDDYFYNREDTP